MSITLYHHPHTRAASVVWMLEEVGVSYEIHHIELTKGDHKSPEIVALNPMGKLPILVDDSVDGGAPVIVTEVAAIGLYLADRYAPGRLAPASDDPRRGAYLRWSLFAPSVIEPASMARHAKWEYRAGSAGWGEYDAMVEAVRFALTPGPFLLGEQFSMADVVFGATLRFMLKFGLVAHEARFDEYVARLEARPALLAADERNASIAAERGGSR
jgi:glutathione S-transferase